MKKKQFSIVINASAEKVWDVLLGQETYPVWTSVFSEGSAVETDWKKGSKALFLDGKGSGMVSVIDENIPNEFLSIRHIGEVINGVEDTESERVKSWAGAHENYRLVRMDGQTEWQTEIDLSPEWEGFFDEVWPKAQAIVKELAEKD